MALALELDDLGLGEEAPIVPDLDLGEFEGVEPQLDLLTSQERIHRVAVALERKAGGASDSPTIPPEKRRAQDVGSAWRTVILARFS